MKAGSSHLSDEWHEMKAGADPEPDKWHAMKVDKEPSMRQPFVKQAESKSDNKVERAEVRTSESGQHGREA